MGIELCLIPSSQKVAEDIRNRFNSRIFESYMHYCTKIVKQPKITKKRALRDWKNAKENFARDFVTQNENIRAFMEWREKIKELHPRYRFATIAHGMPLLVSNNPEQLKRAMTRLGIESYHLGNIYEN